MKKIIFLLILCFSFINAVVSETIFHEFHIRYVEGAPDGVFKTGILSVNDLFPGPTIEANVGDILNVVVYNEIQDGQNVSVHWHGLHQRGTPFEDGANLITQCPLRNGDTQTYIFNLDQPGTYWYHSHIKLQYPEGLWGSLIVHNLPERYDYDGEFIITLSEWFHRTAAENEYWLMSTLSAGVSPYPDSTLLNGIGRYSCEYAMRRSFLQNCSAEIQTRPVFRVTPNNTYRFRVINTSAGGAYRFSIDGHQLQTIEVDGVDVLSPVVADMAVLTPGQRYSFLVTMDSEIDEYLIRADLMTEIIRVIPRENLTPYTEALLPNTTAILKYRDQFDENPASTTEIFDYTQEVPLPIIENPILLDQHLLRPADGIAAPSSFDTQLVLNVQMVVDVRGIRRLTFNGTIFELPHINPVLMTVMEDGLIPDSVMPHIVNYGDVVEIVMNNPVPGNHPIHLHGHQFWLVGSGEEFEGNYDPSIHTLRLDGVRRDTFVVEQFSWAVIRFVADNPGVWNFHCHIDWHNVSGMAATIIEAPEILRANFTIPPEARRVCESHLATIFPTPN